MKVNNKREAWSKADEIFPGDYMIDGNRSKRAGYPIYYSTTDGVNAYICDLGNRLEVNLPSGESVNIWIEPQYAEYQIKDALEVIDDAIYHIDDEIDYRLAKQTGIKAARDKLYAAYDELAKILRESYPDSHLLRRYNL